MNRKFDIKDRFGNYMGRLEINESFNFAKLGILIILIVAGAITIIIWPILYDLFLSKIKDGKTYEVITMSTTIGGVLLGCTCALFFTLIRSMKGGPKSVGMFTSMMLGATVAGVAGFVTSFGTTAVAFVVLGIYSGTFNFLEFLLLLLLSVITSGLSCILPAMITGLVTGIITMVYNIVGGIVVFFKTKA